MDFNILVANRDLDSRNAIISVLKKKNYLNIFTCAGGFSEVVTTIENNNIQLMFFSMGFFKSHEADF